MQKSTGTSGRSFVIAAAVIGLAGVVEGGVVDTQPPMGAPLNGLSPDELVRFFNGRVDYEHVLQVDEGLGPIFNEDSCTSCHNKPVGGTGSQEVTRFGGFDKKTGTFDPLEELGGSLLQAQAINDDCAEMIPVEATITANRVTNGMLGYGLVEALTDTDLLDVREAQDPSVQGFAHMVTSFEDPGTERVGRFGWKSQLASILSFSADASLMEMGLTNRFIMEENDPNGINPPDIEDCDTVDDPEDGPDSNGLDFIDRVTDFQRFLAGPPQTPKFGMTGETIFNNVGCAQCHHPSYTTPDDAGLEMAIRNKTIRPYSDFLLHDVGLNADFIVQGDAGERMLKTPPLWGLRVRDPMWHDGRFEAGTFESRINAAIAGHDSLFAQGQTAAQAYAALSQGDKDLLVQFLDSLGRREFDHTGDNLVQINDFADFKACFFIDVVITPDDPCAISDVDQDGDVDLDDFEGFMSVYEGYRGDCNSNGILDMLDILNGTLTDANDDGTPDECEPTCNGDLDGSGAVDVTDLLAVLGQWGPCPGGSLPCSADFNFDGIVDINDMLLVLALWGACP